MDPFQPNSDSPLDIFKAWLDAAKASELNDPNAAALATATPGGVPSVRIVLVKRVEENGFAFFSNAQSRKGLELAANPTAALCFHWKSLQRQVRVEGGVTEMSADASDEYFHSRQRISQIGAWASQQSRPLASREMLEDRTREFEELYPGEVPRPAYWKGFWLNPVSIEFWAERPYRLHDRVLFIRSVDSWQKERLYP